MAEHTDPRRSEHVPPFPKQEQAHPGVERAMRPQADHGETSYRGLGRMKGKVALVTGGDSGIGRAVCIAFAREGADVAFNYLSEHEDAADTHRLVKEAGREALQLAGDLAARATCERIVAETVKRFGRIDVLVNNAAYQGEAVEHFEELDPDRVEHTFRTNVLSMFHLVRAALPHMQPGGSIINVASIQAYHPKASILDYAATKGAIVTFTKGLAQELGARGIRVNAIAPGPIWTPLVVQSFDAGKNAEFGKDTPLGRPGQPAEVAHSFVFLACDESTYVSGEVLGVTGGKPLM